jgi:hypothetical protein
MDRSTRDSGLRLRASTNRRWISIKQAVGRLDAPASDVSRFLRDQIRWIGTGVGNWSERWRRSSMSEVRTVA